MATVPSSAGASFSSRRAVEAAAGTNSTVTFMAPFRLATWNTAFTVLSYHFAVSPGSAGEAVKVIALPAGRITLPLVRPVPITPETRAISRVPLPAVTE